MGRLPAGRGGSGRTGLHRARTPHRGPGPQPGPHEAGTRGPAAAAAGLNLGVAVARPGEPGGAPAHSGRGSGPARAAPADADAAGSAHERGRVQTFRGAPARRPGRHARHRRLCGRRTAPGRAPQGAPAAGPAGQPAGTARIDALLGRLTLDEKTALLHGTPDPAPLGQAGHVPGVPRLGVPALRLADGPAGVRVAARATALPAPVLLASAFDPALAREYGRVLGREGRALGQDVLLAPMVNLIRTPSPGATSRPSPRTRGSPPTWSPNSSGASRTRE